MSSQNPEIMTTRSGRRYQPSQSSHSPSSSARRPRSATDPTDLSLLAALFEENDSPASQEPHIVPHNQPQPVLENDDTSGDEIELPDVQDEINRRIAAGDGAGSSDRVSEEANMGGVESSWGLDSIIRTQRKILEPAGRIGKKP